MANEAVLQVQVATEKDVNRKNRSATLQMEAFHKAEMGELRRQMSSLQHEVAQQREELNALRGQVAMLAVQKAPPPAPAAKVDLGMQKEIDSLRQKIREMRAEFRAELEALQKAG